MADVGSTTFGYLIAYLLPGLSMSIAAALFSSRVAEIFEVVVQKQNLALGALGAVVAIGVGVFLTLFRALIFEEWLFRSDQLTAEEQSQLADDEHTFRVYRALVDELYRYHQFWGAMSLVLPLLLGGLIWRTSSLLTAGGMIAVIVASLGLEVVTLWAAHRTYGRYVARTRLILEKT